MSGKKNKNKKPSIPIVQKPVTKPAEEKPVQKNRYAISTFSMQSIIIAIIGIIFYCNTFNNGAAFDDNLVILRNEYVRDGFSGIPKIMTTDAYDSYFRQLGASNQLSGGRYRPLSIATFAIEQQLFGKDADSTGNIKSTEGTITTGGNIMQVMHIRHVVNVMLYILSVIALLYFFRTVVFKEQHIIAFMAALIFLIHPIHTEVVANVKSRDEILSLLFITLTFICAYIYRIDKKIKWQLLGLLSYFLALLSKEYGVTLAVLLPLMFYLFNNYNITKSLRASLPYYGVLVLYILMHVGFVSSKGEGTSDIMNDPYLLATGTQRIATETATLLNYLKLLIFPSPLSADYSYNQIPYKDISNPLVWLSVLVHAGLIILAIKFFRSRHLLCFAIAFYLLNLFLISNFIFNIGATMGERLIYHSSVGFAIAAAYLLYKGFEKIQTVATRQRALAGFMVVLVVLCGYKTIARNADWKNDKTLFTTDVHTVPNSVLANENAGASYMDYADTIICKGADSMENRQRKNELTTTAIGYFDKVISLDPHYETGYLNRGLAYYNLGNVDQAKENWDAVKKIAPNYPTLKGLYNMLGNYYVVTGWHLGGQNRFNEAIAVFKKGLEIDPDNPQLWYNLGGAYFTTGNYAEAANAWQKAIQLKPNYPEAQKGLEALTHIKGKK